VHPDYAAATFGGQLAAVATDHPGTVFLRCGAEAMTFAELEQASARIASRLLAGGFRPGDRIAIAALNQPQWLTVFFAATRIGLIVVTLNVRYRESELDYMLNHSGARAVVTHAALPGFDYVSFYAGFAGRIPSVEHVIYLEPDAPGPLNYATLAGSGIDREAVRAAQAGVTPDSPAVILYTSGTTGQPKGAVLTHGSMLASARGEAGRLGVTGADVFIGNMPLNHVGGITCTIATALLARASVVLMPAFSPAGALQAIAERAATIFAGVPTMYALMLGHPGVGGYDLDSVRLTVIGGSNAEPALCEAISKRFRNARLSNLYGLSECSGACVMSAAGDDLAAVSATLGVPLDGVQARVAGPDGTRVADGTDGELQVRGACVAAGYWQMPAETAQTFQPGGWLATGDMVSRSADGHLTMRGRLKEMYVQGGYNVYPAEVENILGSHPAVAMSAGLGIDDPVLGEIGRYYIVVKPGARVSAGELIGHCRERLADYKVPRQVVIVAELPMTPAGKIAKARLRTSPPAPVTSEAPA
jgi:fatty-acyl-CoA synthase